MTISEVFADVDELKPNQYDDAIKIKWINEIEGKIYHEIFMVDDFSPYELSDDFDIELVAQEPYSNIYKLYVMLMIDYTNAEFTRYAQSLAMFNQAFTEYANHMNRTLHKKKYRFKIF